MFKRYFSDPYVGKSKNIVVVDPVRSSRARVFIGCSVSKDESDNLTRYILTSQDGSVTRVKYTDLIDNTFLLPTKLREFNYDESLPFNDIKLGRSYVMMENSVSAVPSKVGDFTLAKVKVKKIGETKSGKIQIVFYVLHDGSTITLSEYKSGCRYSISRSKGGELKVRTFLPA